MSGAQGGLSVLLLVALVVLYWSPSLIAWRRGHKQVGPIMVVNLLLGWTGLGWIAALAWSLSSP